jgi:hypothetical protein
MCLNVFIDIVIEFHHHFLIVTFLPCTATFTFFFTLYNDSLPNMLYHYVPFFPFPLIHSNFHTIYPYFSCLYITPHSTFYVVTGCAEHSGAQVLVFSGNFKTEVVFNILFKIILKYFFLLFFWIFFHKYSV